MQCPKCKATVPGDSKFCQICGSDVRSVISIDHGTPRYDPFSTLGDLDQDTNANIQDDNVIGFSHNGSRKRMYYVSEDGVWRDKETDKAELVIKRDPLTFKDILASNYKYQFVTDYTKWKKKVKNGGCN